MIKSKIEQINLNKVNSNDIKRSIILLDTSGSTDSKFMNSTVLKKEFEIVKEIAKKNHVNGGITNLFEFNSNCNYLGPIKITESGLILLPNINSGGFTNTNLGIQTILNHINIIKPQEIIIITDGQTDSTEQELKKSAKIIEQNNILIKIIAVSSESINFNDSKLLESKIIPGLDIVNYLLVESIIYAPNKNLTSEVEPFIMSSNNKNTWNLLEVKFSKTVPFPSLLQETILKLKELTNDEIMSDIDNFQLLFVQLGTYLAFFYTNVPIVYLKNILSDINFPINDILICIDYGFSLQRKNKPLIHIGLSESIKSSKDRHNEYNDATNILNTIGSAQDECISFARGIVCYKNNNEDLKKSGIFSIDSQDNVYFSWINEQATRQALRQFFAYEYNIKDSIQSHSIIFGVAREILLILLSDHYLTFNNEFIKKLCNLARIQTKMLRMSSKGQYGDSFLHNWTHGNIPTTHYSEYKTHLDLYQDSFINPFNFSQTLWWATMMMIIGQDTFNAQKNVYKDLLDNLSINTREELLDYLRNNYNQPNDTIKLYGNIKFFNNIHAKSVITLLDFEPNEEVYLLKEHPFNNSLCSTGTFYSKSEKEMLGNKCVWCNSILPDSFYSLYKKTNINLLINNDPLRINQTYSKPLVSYSTNLLSNSSLNSNKILNSSSYSTTYSTTNSSLNSSNKILKSYTNSSSSVNIGRHLILLEGTVGSGKTTFANKLYDYFKNSSYSVLIEGTDKYMVTGLTIQAAIHIIRKNLKNAIKNNSIIIIDTCGGNQNVKDIFGVDLSSFILHKIRPNFIETHIPSYLKWSLQNVLNRQMYTSTSDYYLCHQTLGIEKCRQIHRKKAQIFIKQIPKFELLSPKDIEEYEKLLKKEQIIQFENLIKEIEKN